MKKKKIILATALAFEVTLNLNGCGMYGPEPSEVEENKDNDNVSFTIEYNPQDNIEPDAYGPPPTEYNLETTTIGTTSSQEDIQFEPSENIPQIEYGPEFYNNFTEEWF